MGRTIVAEEILQDKLTSIAKSASFQFGLLIGQNAKDKDYIVHIAPTPPDDENIEDENEEAAENVQTNSAESISDVVEDTVVQHARQVIRMLPGGLDILGIYIVTSQSDLNNMANQVKLVKVLNSIHKATSKLLLDTSQPTTEKAVLHVDPQTLKVACKSLDVNLSGSLLVPMELKFQRGNIKWHQISYSYVLNLKLWLSTEKTPSLFKSVLSLVRPWASSVANSLVLIDSNLVDDETMLDAAADEKPSKKKGARAVMDLTPPKVYVAEILDTCGPIEGTYTEKGSAGSVNISGTIAGRAFVQGKATNGDGSRAVISDLIRSVVSRWEMHCDSLVEEQPSLPIGPVVHEPPRRVFLEGGLPVSLCDYLFPGDTAADACSSAKELLDMIVHEENVDETLETLSDVSVLLDTREEGLEDLRRDSGLESTFADKDAPDAPCSFIHVVMAIAIVAVGVGISYLTLQGPKAFT